MTKTVFQENVKFLVKLGCQIFQNIRLAKALFTPEIILTQKLLLSTEEYCAFTLQLVLLLLLSKTRGFEMANLSILVGHRMS